MFYIINMVFVIGFIVTILILGLGIGYIMNLVDRFKRGNKGRKSIYNSMNRKRW